jgi:hypothetical protein
MCNAYNHSFDCDCGFGGDTGGSRGGCRRHVSYIDVLERPISGGWAKDSKGTVESYVNPNAHCPVCGAAVYFYRSPYDGRVFFDELGWPWPKHPCTDNRRDAFRTTRNSVQNTVARPEPKWRAEGWRPLLSSKVYSASDRPLLTGDVEDTFQELHLPAGESLDAHSPIFVREYDGKPDIFDVTFLRSDALGVHDGKAVGYRKRIAAVGEDVILKAASDDPTACYAVGWYLLWRLDDPASARPYLERAAAVGIVDALFDLAVVALFALHL